MANRYFTVLSFLFLFLLDISYAGGIPESKNEFNRIPFINTAQSISYLTQTVPSDRAPLTGTKIVGSGGDFATIKMAVDTLNALGVGTGGVIFNVIAGHSETSANIEINTTTSSASDPILFQKSGSGANPRITAGTGTGSLDGIIKIKGTDYITFDSIDLIESASNTTATTQMEWGYAILKASTSNGSRYVTIKNCHIGLYRLANTNGTFAIYSANHTTSAVTELTVNDTNGTNSWNKFYGNTIDSAYKGIHLSGYNHTSNPYRYYDHWNEVGVEGGNTIYKLGNSSGVNNVYGVYAIYQDSLKVYNNTVNNDTLSNGQTYGIYLSTGSNSTAWVSKNTLSMKNRNSSYEIAGIYVAMGDTTSGSKIINKITVDSNIVENSYPNNGAYTGTFYGIYVSSRPRTVQVSGNTIRNNRAPGTGSMYLLNIAGSPSFLDIYGNSIYSNQKTGASGYMYIIKGGTSKTNVYDNIIYDDSIPNSSGASQMQLYGIYNNGSPLIENYYNNEIYNLGIGGTNTNSNNYIRGIITANFASTDRLIYGNNIYDLTLNLSSASYGSVIGIYNNNGDTNKIYNNRIYSQYAVNGMYNWGIYLGTAAHVFAYNNYVHNLYNSTGNANSSTYGINGGTPVRSYIYNNTIYLDASSSNTLFSSAGLFIYTSTITDIRNNIIINKSTPGGGSMAANSSSLKFSSTSLTNYASTSDRNNFYTGSTLDTNRAIFFDGTNKKYTLASFKSYVTPREANSVTENTTFRNTSTIPYDIRPDSTVMTMNESGGATVSPVTNDCDGLPRYPNTGYPENPLYPATAPDIGANEFGGIPPDKLGPSITYAQFTNTLSTSDRTLSVNIKDSTGVPITGTYKPRIYFKKFYNGTWYSTEGSLISGTGKDGNWDFTVNNSLMGGVTGGDSVYYFVIAQDSSELENIFANPGMGLVATNVNTISIYPTNPNIYKVLINFIGTYSVGYGRTFPDLDSAAKYYNVNELTGAVTFELYDAVDSSFKNGTLPVTFNMNLGSSYANSLTIRPASGVNVLISGNSSLSIIKLNGADYVTIDGSNSKTDSRNISIIDSNTGAGSALWVASLGTNAGCKRVTIKNCIIKNGNNGHIQSYALQISGTSFGSSGDDNDSLTIQNNLISKAYCGIAIGANSSGPNDVLTISGNIIGSGIASEYIKKQGLYLSQNNNVLISKNRIYNVKGDTSNPMGIFAYVGNSNVRITQNDIDSIIYTGSSASGGKGIDIMYGTNITIDNNIIYCISGTGYNDLESHSIAGIRAAGIITGINIYYNSVNIFGSINRSGATNDKCASIYINSSVSTADIRNNIFSNSIENTTGVNTSYSIYSSATASIYNYIDYNDYFASGNEGILGYIYGGNITTISSWRTNTEKDINSFSSNPAFYSNTYLKPLNSSPLLSSGVNITGITYDILDTLRSLVFPSIGAYENGIDNTPPSVSYNPLINIIDTVNRSLDTFAVINDTSGINTATGTKPRIYFKKSLNSNTFTGNSSSNNGWKWTEATNSSSPFSFIINYSLLYPDAEVSVGDTVQYFVVAQDLAEFANVGINQGIFNTVPSSVNLNASAFPVNGSHSYLIDSSISGIVNVGAGQSYTSLTGTGGLFQAVNNKGLGGNLTAYIVSDITEPGTFALYRIPGDFTLHIRPNSSVTRTLSGSCSKGLIRLYGADRVTIDGSYNNSGSYLTIKNNSTSSNTCAVQFGSLGRNSGASNDTIRNCNLMGGANNNDIFGIYLGDTSCTASGKGCDNDSLVLINNNISKCKLGVFVYGVADTGLVNNLEISGNTIGSDISANYVTGSGIDIKNCSTLVISKNHIYNIHGPDATRGISFGNVANADIYKNNIHSVYSGTFANSYGIDLWSSSGISDIRINNNIFYDLKCGSSSSELFVLNIANGTGIKVFYNTVNLFGQINYAYTYILFLGAGISDCDIYNNSFSNSESGNTNVSYIIKSDSIFANNNINYNNYFSGNSKIYIAKFKGSSKITLTDWKASVPEDSNSISVNPYYNSNTNLIPESYSSVLNAGTPLTGYNYDYLDTLRNATNPSIGAYEKGRDMSSPNISYTQIPRQYSLANLTLDTFAIVTDSSGVNITSGNRPRIYYKKFSNVNSYSGNSSSNNGWKWIEASNSTSPFSFTIDYSKLYPTGSVNYNDTIQYFVVAQDLASVPNVGINSGTFNSAPSEVNLGSPAFPVTGTINNYKIYRGFSDTIYVGTGKTYTTLTDTDGLFKAINDDIVKGNLTIIITSDIYEPGTVALKETIEETEYKINIQPDSAVMRTLSGSCSKGLIRLENADRITIDGSYNGAGRYLTIKNNNAGANTAAIQFDGGGNGASSDTIRNCIISAGSGSVTTFGIYIGDGTCSSAGYGYNNDGIVIFNNDISRCQYGIFLNDASSGPADNLKIICNSIGSDDSAFFVTRSGIDIKGCVAPEIKQNVIFNIKADQDYALRGISIGNTYNTDISRNNIHCIKNYRSYRDVYGIDVWDTNDSSLFIYNNIIYDLNGKNVLIKGISVSAGKNHKIYYNTVNLFGQVIQNLSATSYAMYLWVDNGNCSLLDNILSNSMTGASGSKSYAVCLYNASSVSEINNNDYFIAGSNGILGKYGGSDIQTITEWKTSVPSDSSSFSANPLFNSDTVLIPHPVSPVLSAGIPVAGITNDYLDTLRNVVNPSIGAYEKGIDKGAPSITYSQLSGTGQTVNRVLIDFAAISDPGGVDTSAGKKPRIYYKKSVNNNTYVGNSGTDNGWKWTESTNQVSPFSFLIDYSKLYPSGSVALGDTIQYLVVAQDKASVPNVGIFSGQFAIQPSSVELGSSAFPVTGTISGYIISAFSDTVYVGTGQQYTTLTGSGGLFEGINKGAVTGNLTVIIKSDITETGTNALNQTYEELNYRIRIIPDTNIVRNLTGNCNTGGLIRIKGADRITIDGRYNGAGNYIAIKNNSNYNNTAAVQFTSAGSGAQYDTIRNCIISNNDDEINTVGIYIGDSVVSESVGGINNRNITLIENEIKISRYGILAVGDSTSKIDSLTIEGNTIGSYGYNEYIGRCGIMIRNASAPLINNNHIFRVMSYENSAYGISLVGSVPGTLISRNLIHQIERSGSSGSTTCGISVGSGTGITDCRIFNNLIHDIRTSGNHTNFNNPFGIRIDGGSNHKIYYNSVNMYGNLDGYYINQEQYYSSAILITDSSISGLDIRNNIFSNRMAASGYYTPYIYAIYVVSGTTFSTIDYNDYYSYSTAAFYRLGYLGANKYNLNEWKTATGQDTHSISSDPKFISNSNLAPYASSPVLGIGIPLPDVLFDYTGSERNAIHPSIGGYEYAFDTSGPVINYITLGNTTSTANRKLNSVYMTDSSRVDTLSDSRPRLYFRRSTDANTYNDNTSLTDGWKYVKADSNTGSPFLFTINYSLLSGDSGVHLGTRIQYFVIAQDKHRPVNFTVNSGTLNSTPSGVNLVSSNFPVTGTINSYKIVDVGMSGDYHIGLTLFNQVSGKNISFIRAKRTVGRYVHIISDEDIKSDKYKSINENKQFEESQNREKSDSLVGDAFNVASSELAKGKKMHYEWKDVQEEYAVPVENGNVYNGDLLFEYENSGNQIKSGKNPGKGVYATITAALTDLKDRGISGPVNLILDDTLYSSSETFPLIIDTIIGSGSGNTVTIKPNTGVNTIITGSVSSDAIIKYYNTNYITIDGSNKGTSSRNLTIKNTSTSSPVVVWFGSKGTGEINFNTLKNTNIINGGPGTASAIVAGDGDYLFYDGFFRNIIIHNNEISNSWTGIYMYAYRSGSYWSNFTTIDSNTFNSSVGYYNMRTGIYINGINYSDITYNVIKKILYPSYSYCPAGIYLDANCYDIMVKGNTIDSVSAVSYSRIGAFGIQIHTESSETMLINNSISGITSLGSNDWVNNPIGILIYGNQYNIYVLNNSINLYGNTLNSSGAASIGVALRDNSTAYIKNNCIVNTLGLQGVTGYGAVGIYAQYSNGHFQAIENNNYYVNASSGTNAIGRIGSNTYTTLSAFRSATGGDFSSYAGNPGYLSDKNLLPDTTNQNCWNLYGKGMPLSVVSTDIRNLPRSTTLAGGPTCIGAYEFTTTINPPVATASGSPVAGDTISYTQTGRALMEIIWGSSKEQIANIKEQTSKSEHHITNNAPDALPTTVNFQYFSGITPPDTANIPIAKTGKGFWYIDTDGDPAQPVNFKIYWGNQELGNITDTSKLILAMYDMKNRVWLPFERGTSGNGYSIVNHTEKSITVNGIPRVDSVIFALTDKDQPLKRLRLDLNCIIAGFWYDRGSGYNTMKPDTITAIIRTTNPWTPVDSVKIRLDSSGYGYGYTSLANLGTGYYIEINHRNSLSTWSSDSTTGFSRVAGTYLFDLTSSQGKAYGNNLIQVGTKWCIINGDVNRDDWIDGSDYLDIFNNYDTGGEFMTPDTNGDDWIDGSDYLIIFNNYDVGAIIPVYGKFLKPVKKNTPIQPEIINKIKHKVIKLYK